MYPYVVFGLLDENITDEQVHARYVELVRRHPPDKDPERFQIIQRAYDGLRTAEARMDTRLFYYDAKDNRFTRDYEKWMETRTTRRLSASAVRQLVRKAQA